MCIITPSLLGISYCKTLEKQSPPEVDNRLQSAKENRISWESDVGLVTVSPLMFAGVEGVVLRGGEVEMGGKWI